jgi:phage terminase large subunit
VSKVIELPAYGWAPREDQMPAWTALEQGEKKLIVLAAHRRFGKDELGLQAVATKAMQRIGSYYYCLPEYAQARKAIWNGVNHRTGRTRIDDALPPELINRRDNQEMFIQLKNGSTLQMVGSDNYNSLVGAGPVGMVMSESAIADPAAWGFFRPMLLESNGWALHISTPRGKNHFYNLVENNRTNPNAFVQVLSANDTKVFTQAQLSAERHNFIQEHGAVLGNALFNQEYLCSFEASTIGAVWGPEIQELKDTGRAGPCGYDPRYPVHTSWDLGIGDDTVVLFWQEAGTEARLIDYYAANDSGLEHYANMLAQRGYHYGKHFAPHDIAAREWGAGTTRLEQALRLGLRFERVPNTRKTDQMSLGAQLMRRTIINTTKDLVTGDEACSYVLEALSQYRFVYDPARKIMSATPKHDWTSHYADAFMTYAIARAKPGAYAPAENTQQMQTYNNLRLSHLRHRPTATSAWG